MYFPRLKELREEKGLTRAEVAENLNISEKRYSKIEESGERFNGRQAAALADLYQTSVDYLLGHSDNRAPYP